MPFYALGEDRFFSADGAPEAVAARRRDGFRRLAQIFAERYPRSADLTEEVTGHISDLQFTGRYRVPFPFSSVVRRHLRGGAFVQASSGVTLTDLDGNRFYDLAGSYGVNVFGYDFYKGCIDRAAYTRWLRELREVCSECGIVLILDVSAWPWAGPRNISASAPTW